MYRSLSASRWNATRPTSTIANDFLLPMAFYPPSEARRRKLDIHPTTCLSHLYLMSSYRLSSGASFCLFCKADTLVEDVKIRIHDTGLRARHQKTTFNLSVLFHAIALPTYLTHLSKVNVSSAATRPVCFGYILYCSMPCFHVYGWCTNLLFRATRMTNSLGWKLRL